MRFLAILSGIILLQAVDGDAIYKYPAGTTWTYDADFGGSKRRVTYKITEVRDGKRYVDFDIFREGDPGATASDNLLWFEKDGFVEWEIDEGDGTSTPRFRIWKKGAKPGDTWAGPEGSESMYVGDEDVTTPAGRYAGAAHVRVRAEATFDYWFAAGVGMIRVVRDDGTRQDILELRERVQGGE